MNILIVDDEPLSRSELSYLLKQNITVTSVSEAEGIKDALGTLLAQKIDLIFLDISLNEENGFTLAKELKQLADPPLVIFATAYDKYALQAFDINAIDYVLKPFEQTRINQALKKANAALSNRRQLDKAGKIKTNPMTDFITLTAEEKTAVIKTKDIVSATVDNGFLTVTTNDNRTFVSHETLSWIKKQLDPQKFIQVHRSAIVCVDFIREIQPWFNHTFVLILTNDARVPVGRSFIKELKQRLNM
ncbi:autolysis response regulater LytR [Liquorilactobacillus sucicola DSM 21376 = JCM 15457]|uniref:Response regulator n=1 Tax=Liquorilactobacillus sucicola DSM 21376 = JCM 15457 TaxID=1423806 RepID=A0A023CZK1_9LACO|nr:LytTR family transcriptional regulator DNA-binding domain-containing protein [Liquorilactobacillus sucicola]KRN06748.1 response regulator [Liquorilactobacillus sucicola DSM 21376 = JCM 15457]GAJ27021.1 autolysis response regulater LytR [Liquorilactobacillus sucicola DSM 21376 = JCM 15457]